MLTKQLIHRIQYNLRNILRFALSRTLYPVGSIRTIILGSSRGLRYRVFPEYGLAALFGRSEPDVQHLVTKIVKSGYSIYDIGANYGIHTLLFAKIVGSQGFVYAFEPNPFVFRQLRENLLINNLNHALALPVAIANEIGSALFELDSSAAVGHLQNNLTRSSDSLVVPVTTIDALVFEHGFKPPQLIKIDVEGAESKVLRGAMQTIKTHRPILIVELHTPEQDIAVGHILIECSYQAYRISTGEMVTNLSQGWPHKDGLLGQFVAYPQVS